MVVCKDNQMPKERSPCLIERPAGPKAAHVKDLKKLYVGPSVSRFVQRSFRSYHCVKLIVAQRLCMGVGTLGSFGDTFE